MIEKIRENIRFNTLLFWAFITCLILIYSTYAWFYSSLDVKISNFKAKVDPEMGLYISLDGVNWGSTVDISKENIIDNLNDIYPNHTNQWSKGLTSVSTVGQKTIFDNKFTIYGNKKPYLPKFSFLNTDRIDLITLDETKSNSNAEFIAFDLFFKNLTTSPYSDNLYLIDGTRFYNSSVFTDDTAANAIRLGFLFQGSVSKKATVNEIQNISCTNGCSQHIFEPNSTNHNESSINILSQHGVTLEPGIAYPTYAVYRQKDRIQMWAGIENSNIPFDHSTFQKQITATALNTPIGELPSGITKVRVYIWIEAQDIDIVEQVSTGYKVSIILNFEKDMAGYE